MVTAILFGTGVLWLLAHYGMRAAGEFAMAHPLEPWSLRLHGLAVMLGLFLYGSLLRSHMIKGWNGRKNRATGVLVVSVLVCLMFSGYLLYYVAGETLRPVVSAIHWGVGLALGAALPLHVWCGRRQARSYHELHARHHRRKTRA